MQGRGPPRRPTQKGASQHVFRDVPWRSLTKGGYTEKYWGYDGISWDVLNWNNMNSEDNQGMVELCMLLIRGPGSHTHHFRSCFVI